jgi:hypothetical protein
LAQTNALRRRKASQHEIQREDSGRLDSTRNKFAATRANAVLGMSRTVSAIEIDRADILDSLRAVQQRMISAYGKAVSHALDRLCAAVTPPRSTSGFLVLHQTISAVSTCSPIFTVDQAQEAVLGVST